MEQNMFTNKICCKAKKNVCEQNLLQIEQNILQKKEQKIFANENCTNQTENREFKVTKSFHGDMWPCTT